MSTDRMLRRWRKYHQQQLDEALAGPHGMIVVQVVEFLKTMTPASANALLTLMRSQSWAGVDATTKFILLHTINDAITDMRATNNMPPIDDALPHERATAFLIIRELLGA
jgi:hypothetical protein